MSDVGGGQAAKEEGIGRAERAANPLWKAEMYAYGVESAREKPVVLVDDLRDKHDERGQHHTHTNNAMAGIMRELVKNEIIEDTGRVTKSRRVSRHRGLIKVWSSKIFGVSV